MEGKFSMKACLVYYKVLSTEHTVKIELIKNCLLVELITHDNKQAALKK